VIWRWSAPAALISHFVGPQRVPPQASNQRFTLSSLGLSSGLGTGQGCGKLKFKAQPRSRIRYPGIVLGKTGIRHVVDKA
jgi:hypothetical protein